MPRLPARDATPHLVHITTLPQTAASFLHGQLAFMRSHGLRVTIVSSPGDQLDQFAEQEQIDAATVPLERAISPVRDVVAITEMVQLFRRIRPTIVHTHTPKAGLVGMVAATLAGVEHRIYHLHGLRFETSRQIKRQVLKTAEAITCQLANLVLCVSSSLRQKAIAERLVTARGSRVLCHGSINGLDVTQFDSGPDRQLIRRVTRRRLGIPDNALCLGFVGRLVRDKGIEDLHNAWKQLRDLHLDLHLLLVGPFEQQDSLAPQLRAQLLADPRVHLTGLDWNTRPYFAAMDVFCLPSLREGLGHVLLEAGAMGLPSVACRVTGCVDAIEDKRTGLLVPPHAPHALARAVESYLYCPTLRRQHGQQARRHVGQRFAPQKIWTAQLELYRQMLGWSGVESARQTTSAA